MEAVHGKGGFGKRERVWFALGCVGLAIACSGDGPEAGSDDPRTLARDARVEVYRDGIADFAEKVCRKHDTANTPFGPACLEAARAFLEAVADQVARAPVDWVSRLSRSEASASARRSAIPSRKPKDAASRISWSSGS